MKIALIYNEVDTDSGVKGIFEAEADVLDERDAVATALKKLGHNVKVIPLKDDIPAFINVLISAKADLVFNLVESVFGDSSLEMCVPAVLDLLKMPYTGASSLSMALAIDKAKTRQILKAAGVPVPDHAVINSFHAFRSGDLKFPLILKPLREDGSIGISADSVVFDGISLSKTAEQLLPLYNKILAESYIEGREFNVAILGNETPQVLPVSEIDFSGMPAGAPNILSYRAKWIKESPEYSGSKPVCPAKITAGLKSKLEDCALKAYRALGLSCYGRIDFRADESGSVYVIDVNPNPCIAPDAGLVRSAAAAGISYPELIKKIIEYAVNKKGGVLSESFKHS